MGPLSGAHLEGSTQQMSILYLNSADIWFVWTRRVAVTPARPEDGLKSFVGGNVST